ncbi:preprotein translocase subunit SecE [Desulforudis sp. 1088]|uniref:preprotein translocase subunit SecE n=1 Tax=unclassified Candidatus Desulforudis TaxID=2635950 RepID=UPI00347723DF
MAIDKKSKEDSKAKKAPVKTDGKAAGKDPQEERKPRKPLIFKKDNKVSAKDPKREVTSNKRKANLNFLTVRRFFEEVVRELKKVHWPTRREVVIYTSVVLVSVTLVGIVIWIFDSILSQVLGLIIR